MSDNKQTRWVRRWVAGRVGHWASGNHESTPAADEFLADILAVCKEYGLSISHEDTHGAFVIVQYNDKASEWLLNAMYEPTPKPTKDNQ